MNPTASLRHELCSELGKTLCNRAFINSLQSRVIICLWFLLLLDHKLTEKDEVFWWRQKYQKKWNGGCCMTISSCQDSWSEGIKLHLQYDHSKEIFLFWANDQCSRLNQFISMVAIVTTNRAQTGYFILSSSCVSTYNLRLSWCRDWKRNGW